MSRDRCRPACRSSIFSFGFQIVSVTLPAQLGVGARPLCRFAALKLYGHRRITARHGAMAIHFSENKVERSLPR